jgi:hypothetical protein
LHQRFAGEFGSRRKLLGFEFLGLGFEGVYSPLQYRQLGGKFFLQPLQGGQIFFAHFVGQAGGQQFVDFGEAGIHSGGKLKPAALPPKGAIGISGNAPGALHQRLRCFFTETLPVPFLPRLVLIFGRG